MKNLDEEIILSAKKFEIHLGFKPSRIILDEEQMYELLSSKMFAQMYVASAMHFNEFYGLKIDIFPGRKPTGRPGEFSGAHTVAFFRVPVFRVNFLSKRLGSTFIVSYDAVESMDASGSRKKIILPVPNFGEFIFIDADDNFYSVKNSDGCA